MIEYPDVEPSMLDKLSAEKKEAAALYFAAVDELEQLLLRPRQLSEKRGLALTQ